MHINMYIVRGGHVGGHGDADGEAHEGARRLTRMQVQQRIHLFRIGSLEGSSRIEQSSGFLGSSRMEQASCLYPGKNKRVAPRPRAGSAARPPIFKRQLKLKLFGDEVDYTACSFW